MDQSLSWMIEERTYLESQLRKMHELHKYLIVDRDYEKVDPLGGEIHQQVGIFDIQL